MIEEVFDAYYDCREHKRSKRSSVQYEMNYELSNLGLWRELNDMTYRPGRSIGFCVTTPKLREVFAADFRDRVVHHLLIRRIEFAVETMLTDAACACRKGKGTLYAVHRLTDMMKATPDGWYVRCDIRGFFMSIDKAILLGIVRDIVHKACPTDTAWWLWLAETIVLHRPEADCELHGDTSLWNLLPDDKTLFRTGGRGLPIGNLPSQVLANAYLAAFDEWAIKRLGSEMRYIRYADDIVMVHPDRHYLLEVLRTSREWLRDNRHLTIHPRKICIQQVRRGVRFVGHFIKGGVIHTGKRQRENSLALTNSWGRRGSHTHEERLRLMSRYNSYCGLLRHTASWRIRRKMWRTLLDYSAITNINMNKIKIRKL